MWWTFTFFQWCNSILKLKQIPKRPLWNKRVRQMWAVGHGVHKLPVALRTTLRESDEVDTQCHCAWSHAWQVCLYLTFCCVVAQFTTKFFFSRLWPHCVSQPNGVFMAYKHRKKVPSFLFQLSLRKEKTRWELLFVCVCVWCVRERERWECVFCLFDLFFHSIAQLCLSLFVVSPSFHLAISIFSPQFPSSCLFSLMFSHLAMNVLGYGLHSLCSNGTLF